MKDKREYSFLRLRRLYKFINKNYIVEAITICLLVTGIVCDWLLKNSEDFNHSDLGTIISFVITLVAFYLEHMEDRRYGIRIMDILLEDVKYSEIAAKVLLLGIELVVWIVSEIFELKYTLMQCSVSQIILLLYVFVMICVELSDINIRDVIKKRAIEEIENDERGQNGVCWMLSKMLSAINYNDKQEQIFLVKFLCEIVGEGENTKGIQSFSKGFTEHIIWNCEKRGVAIEIINNSLACMEDISGKRGIVEAVLLHSDDMPVEVVVNTDFEARREIIVWAITYCVFQSGSPNKEYLRITARKLEECLEKSLEEGDAVKDWQKILEYWVELKMSLLTAEVRRIGRFYLEFDRLGKLL